MKISRYLVPQIFRRLSLCGILLLVFQLLFISSLHAQNCSDTAFQKLYKSLTGELSNTQCIVTKNEQAVLIGNYYNTAANDSSIYVIKLSSSGNVLWAKKIKSLDHFALPHDPVEMDNGDIAFSVYSDKKAIVKLNSNGGLIFGKTFSVSTIDEALNYFNLYASGNELYVSFASLGGAVATSNLNQGISITKLDNNANNVWSKYYFQAKACGNPIPRALIKIKDSLVVIGRISPESCSLLPTQTTEVSLFAMKVSNQNGTLGKSVSYTVPLEFGASNYNLLAGIYPLNISKTNNDEFYFTSRQFNYQNSNGKINRFKVRFDADLNVFEGSQYTTDKATPRLTKIDVDENGNTNIICYDNNNAIFNNEYFAKFDRNNNVIRQKKISASANAFAYSSGQNPFVRKRNYLDIVTGYKKNNQSYLQLLQLNNEEQNSDCFGKDTSFVTVSPYIIAPAKSPFFDTSVDVVTTITDIAGLTVIDLPVLREDVCQQISICSSIKVFGQDTVCNLDQNYIYKATLNGSCYKHVFWQVDTSAIELLTTLNDSTVSLKFKKSFSGYLYASVNACMDLKDSIKVSVFNSPEKINLGNDTSFCTGQQLLLNATPAFKKYKWQDNSTDSFFIAKQTEKYFVQATNYCNVVLYDTINILVNKPTEINIGNDTTICIGQSIVLTTGNKFTSYLWNTGAISETIVASAKGIYSVKVINNYGCASQDSMAILNNFPLPFFSLSKKDVVCKDQNDTLFVDKSFAKYLWQDGSTSSYYRVTSPGFIKVIVTNQYGCYDADSVTIKEIANAPTNFLDKGLSVCAGETILLKTVIPFTNYLWSNRSVNSSINVLPGYYSLQVTDENGCEGNDSVFVTPKDCNTIFFVPSSFTPNDDALNDLFKPVISGRIEQYEFSIYNRWGQLVFKTNTTNDGWNGQLKGEPQKTGTYVWYCTYKAKNENKIIRKGSVSLLR